MRYPIKPRVGIPRCNVASPESSTRSGKWMHERMETMTEEKVGVHSVKQKRNFDLMNTEKVFCEADGAHCLELN